jgi:DNA-binding XRE family transcriptional regulator
MLPTEFRALRTRFHLTQEAVGASLGLSRITIQNWERGATPIPHDAELWLKRRPQFGPVRLLFWRSPPIRIGGSSPMFRSAPDGFIVSDNDSALRWISERWGELDFVAPFVTDEEGNTVWNTKQLEDEVERRRGHMTKADKGLAERLMEIGRHFSALPVADANFTVDDLYDEDGLPK